MTNEQPEAEPIVDWLSVHGETGIEDRYSVDGWELLGAAKVWDAKIAELQATIVRMDKITLAKSEQINTLTAERDRLREALSWAWGQEHVKHQHIGRRTCPSGECSRFAAALEGTAT